MAGGWNDLEASSPTYLASGLGRPSAIGLAESVEQTSPFGLAYSCHGLYQVVRFLMWIHVSKE